MAGIYKLIFDLALYYTLAGFYIGVFFSAAPSVPGILLLVLIVVLDAILRRQKVTAPAPRIAILCLPLLTLLAHPGIWPLIHLVPAWVYLGYCIFTGRVETELGDFRSHFSFGLSILLLILPAFLLSKRAAGSFVAIVPYLAIMLAVGVCLLRMLREKTRSGVKQGVYMSVFILACAALTVGKAPQMVGLILKTIYQYVLAPLLLGGVLLVGFGFYGIFKALFWLAALLRKEEPEPVEMDLRSAAEMMGLEEAYDVAVKDHPIARIIGYCLLALAVAAVLFLIFRRLLGNRDKGEEKKPYEESREGVLPPAKRRRPGLTRPREPRLAVRYYYARFLRECRRRSVDLRPGMTSEELAEACSYAFPGVDTAVLQRLYVPARYSDYEPVTAADADRAADAWHALKRSKSALGKA